MLMRAGGARALTEGEREMAADTFGDELDLDRVRVWASRTVGWTTKRTFCVGGMLLPGRSVIIYPPDDARADFAAKGTPLYTQSVFIHEMTHVWQSQRGVKLLLAKLKAGDKPESYAYDLTPPCEWTRFNIEQQAMIVQDDFLRRRGARVKHAETAYKAVLPFRRDAMNQTRIEA